MGLSYGPAVARVCAASKNFGVCPNHTQYSVAVTAKAGEPRGTTEELPRVLTLRDATMLVVSSVIGAGADVRGEGRLERVVVWPGAQAFAPLRDAVVTRTGLVVPREAA